MSPEKFKWFYLANLGPEVGRYLSFKNQNNFLQMKNSLKRIEQIIISIFCLDNINLNTKKELESLYDKITQPNHLKANTFDNYFYPIILKFSNFA